MASSGCGCSPRWRPPGSCSTGEPALTDGGRLFLAVTPPPAAVEHLASALAPLRDLPGAPRWTRADRWHVTLLFLGEVAGAAVGPLGAAAARAVAASAPMTLRIAGTGTFGSRRRPQVCWAGLDGDVAELTALAGRLAAAARGLGLPVEDRPFRAHLTVGRWRPGRPADPEPVTRLAGYRGPRWPAERVELLRSHLGPEARYESIASWPVGRPA